MPNFHPILFKFCGYVKYMLIYHMYRELKFPMTITNLAALFLELFKPPLVYAPNFVFISCNSFFVIFLIKFGIDQKGTRVCMFKAINDSFCIDILLLNIW